MRNRIHVATCIRSARKIKRSHALPGPPAVQRTGPGGGGTPSPSSSNGLKVENVGNTEGAGLTQEIPKPSARTLGTRSIGHFFFSQIRNDPFSSAPHFLPLLISSASSIPHGLGLQGRMASRGSSARPGEGPNEAPSTSEGAVRETVLGNCTRCGSGERLKFCSRCQAVRYCSPDCQKADVRGRGEG